MAEPVKFDVRKFVNDELGYKLLDVGSEPGKVVVEVPQEESVIPQSGGVAGFLQAQQAKLGPTKQELDLNSYLRDAGVDPATVNYDISRPEAPLPKSDLNFIDRLKLSIADSHGDKQRLLSEIAGQDNVKFSPEANGFVVKDSSGNWRVAEDDSTQNFLSQIVGRESGSIAAGIAGAQAGAAAGTAVAPGIGTLAGAAIGGGIGAVLGKIGTLETAKALGLRTEEDADAIRQELGKDFLFGLGGELTVPAIKVAGKGAINLLKKSVRHIGEKAASPGARLAISEALEGITGVPRVDNMTWLEMPEHVAQHQRKVVDWMASGEGKGLANPVQREMAEQVQAAVTKSKETMLADYGKIEAKLAPVTDNVAVNISPIVQDTTKEFKNLGLIDDSGKWLSTGEQQLAQVINPSSVRQLRRSYEIIKKATTRSGDDVMGASGVVPFKDAQILKRNMDEILEAAGHYNASDYALTSPAKRQIIKLRAELNNASIKALEGVNPEAAKLYSDMNAKYSQRAGWLDELAGRVDDFKVDATIKNMLGENGQRVKDVMGNILKDTGINSEIFMNNLLTRRAALNTAPMYRQGSSGIGSRVSGALRMTSPRKTTPLVANNLNRLQKTAQATDWVRNLRQDLKDQLLQDPMKIRVIMAGVANATQAEEQQNQQLLQQSLQGMGGGQ